MDWSHWTGWMDAGWIGFFQVQCCGDNLLPAVVHFPLWALRYPGGVHIHRVHLTVRHLNGQGPLFFSDLRRGESHHWMDQNVSRPKLFDPDENMNATYMYQDKVCMIHGCTAL